MESVFKNVKVVYRNVNEVEKALGIENYHELTSKKIDYFLIYFFFFRIRSRMFK